MCPASPGISHRRRRIRGGTLDFAPVRIAGIVIWSTHRTTFFLLVHLRNARLQGPKQLRQSPPCGRSIAMRFLLECKFAVIFAAVLTFCSVMVLRQSTLNQSAHSELREAFVILHSRGYTNEAQRL